MNMVNGPPFAPMLDTQASAEQTVRRHLNGIMHAMGSRYAVSLVLDDTMDASNSGVLSNSTDPWRAAVAAINAAAKASPLDETVRQQIGKALGLQATAVVTTQPDVADNTNMLRMALMRLQSFTDENGKTIIRKALGGDVVPDESDPVAISIREQMADFMLRRSIPTGHGDTFSDLLIELGGWVDEMREKTECDGQTCEHCDPEHGCRPPAQKYADMLPSVANSMEHIVADVEVFHRATDVPILHKPTIPGPDRVSLRAEILREEIGRELLPALEQAVWWPQTDTAGSNTLLVQIADGIADSIYVLVGTAIEFGIPLHRVWAEVHAANMRKVDPETGKVRKREDGKVLKPEGWTPPDISKAVFGE